MTLKTTLIIACLFQAFFAFSQDSTASLQQRFDQESIYLSPRFWQGMTFVRNGASTPTGGYFKRLEKVVHASPDARPFMQNARQNAYLQNMISLVPASILLFNELNGLNREETDADLVREARTFGLCLTFSVMVEAPLKYRTHQLLHHATWLYNRDVLFGFDRASDFTSPMLDRYNQQTIYLKPTQLSGMKYVKGGKTLNAAYFSGELANEFERTPSARLLYDQAVTNRRTSRAAGAFAIISNIAGVVLMLDASNDFDNNQPINEGATVAKAISGVGLTLIGSVLTFGVQMPLSFKSERQLSEAVHQHNREVLFYGADH